MVRVSVVATCQQIASFTKILPFRHFDLVKVEPQTLTTSHLVPFGEASHRKYNLIAAACNCACALHYIEGEIITGRCIPNIVCAYNYGKKA